MLTALLRHVPLPQTNLFADAMAKHDIRGARRVVASTITLAAVLGAILGLILFFGGEALMRLLAGDASEDVVPLALQVHLGKTFHPSPLASGARAI